MVHRVLECIVFEIKFDVILVEGCNMAVMKSAEKLILTQLKYVT